MSVMAEDVMLPRRLHIPRKVLGENFYPYLYGVYRTQRIQAMAKARLKGGDERSALAQEARKANHECVWCLRRTKRKP